MWNQRWLRTLVGTAAAGILAACSQPTQPGENYSRLRVVGVPGEASPPLDFRLEAPAQVPRGAVVPFRLVLANAGVEPLELGMVSEEFDIVVTRPDGTIVWENLFGLDFSSMLVLAVL
jgi:hypothetical protein